jgi:hypothetical protein
LIKKFTIIFIVFLTQYDENSKIAVKIHDENSKIAVKI